MTVSSAIISIENGAFSQGSKSRLRFNNAEPIPKEVVTFYTLFEQYKNIKLMQ